MAAKITILKPTADQEFAITSAPAMPEVEFEAKIEGADPDPTATTDFESKAEITFTCSTCPKGKAIVIAHPEVKVTASGGKGKITFSQFRGGTLNISITAKVGTETLTAKVAAKIVGTNPTRAEIQAKFPDKSLRQVVSHESSFRQFAVSGGGSKAACPLFSADGLGGVGLTQLTNPAPEPDHVWSWVANLNKGVKVLAEKRAVAKGYPAQVRKNASFTKLAADFNKKRKDAGKKELTITLPDFTEDQLSRDTLRGYNGFAGKDAFGQNLHEFRVKLDSDGNLVVTEDPSGTTGTCEWEQVPVADRPQKSGDPNYVENVLKQVV